MTKKNKILLISTLMAISTSETSAQESTHELFHPEFRLEKCDHTAGFGVFSYHNRAPVISSMCINRDTGDIVSTENLNGFIIAQSNNETINFVSKGDENSNLRIGLHNTFTPFNLSKIDQSYDVSYSNGSINLHGYTISSTSGEKIDDKYFAYMQVDGLLFIGEANFKNSISTIELKDDYSYGFSENGSGTAVMEVDDNGRVYGKLSFSTKNAFKHGYQSEGWSEISIEVPDFFGHALGDKGETIRAFGIADIKTESHKRKTHVAITLLNSNLFSPIVEQ